MHAVFDEDRPQSHMKVAYGTHQRIANLYIESAELNFNESNLVSAVIYHVMLYANLAGVGLT